MNEFIITAAVTFIGLFVLVPIALAFARLFGVYTIVQERQCKVYVLFGKVIGQLDEPGLHLLFPKLGLRALIVNFSGRCYTLDMALDQSYLRS
jgi:regulator of protease activity HflC (stomatin/prohibitin superfamily)